MGSIFGATFPGLYAMIAMKHMHDYGTTKEQLAQVAVKNHKNGVNNPYAQYRREITLETALNASPVAYPLGLFDCSPVTDGAASIVLCAADIAKKYTDKPVKIIGSGQASDTLSLHGRREICTLDATVYAANMAYKQANIAPEDPTEGRSRGNSNKEKRLPVNPPKKNIVRYSGKEKTSSALNPKINKKSMFPKR